MAKKVKILVAPLNWGLGHATRCIPIIDHLLSKHAEVVIGSDGRAFELLKKTYPQLSFVELPAYNITYASGPTMVFKLLMQLPKLFKAIRNEHKLLDELVQVQGFDAVISDNRFGLFSKRVKTVFITHQVFIQAPVFKGIVNRINHYFIKKFDQCWIPDVSGEVNLSGSLSHAQDLPLNCTYIGWLSRFNNVVDQLPTATEKFPLIALVSGPEPQRTIFEKKLIEQLSRLKQKALVVLGKPEGDSDIKKIHEFISQADHLGADELHKRIVDADVIVARPGYTTLMDLVALNKKVIFVPTPGQTEQEYLAEKLTKDQLAYCVDQGRLILEKDIEFAFPFVLKLAENEQHFKSNINLFLNSLNGK